MMYRISWLLGLYMGLLLLPSGSAQADDGAEAVIRAATARIYQALQRECQSRPRDPDRIFVLVDEILLPHADFETMSRWVMGKYWKRTSEHQRQRIMQEFKALLVRTYATAIRRVSPVDIAYLPERSSGKAHKAVVRTEVRPPGEAAFPVHYHMRERDGRWLVYDVRIEGVSLVASYRSTFNAEIAARGIQGLLNMLEENNRKQMARRNSGSRSARAGTC